MKLLWSGFVKRRISAVLQHITCGRQCQALPSVYGTRPVSQYGSLLMISHYSVVTTHFQGYVKAAVKTRQTTGLAHSN